MITSHNLSGSCSFPEAGFYILKEKDDFLMVRCGPLPSQGISCHAHNDCLSFELSAGALDFIIDPGTYIYTAEPKERNWFRSSAAHNAMWVVGQEQNALGSSVFDYAADAAQGRLLKWKSTADQLLFSGEHYGFWHEGVRLRQRRTIIYLRAARTWNFRDELLPKNPAELPRSTNVPVQWAFTLDPAVEAIEFDKNVWLLRNQDVTLKWSASIQGAHTNLAQSFYSPRYGQRLDTQVLSVQTVAPVGFSGDFSLELFKGDL